MSVNKSFLARLTPSGLRRPIDISAKLLCGPSLEAA